MKLFILFPKNTGNVTDVLVVTFNSPGVSADPPDVLPRSPGTGVPGALPPEEDCLALSFFLVSLTDDK